MEAFEVSGHINKSGHLLLNPGMRLKEGDVKVIVMYEERDEKAEEQDWLRFVSRNPEFDFLREPEEDIYSLSDGKPLDDET